MVDTSLPAPAQVLAFPADRARPPSPETRLARALASLQAALAEQKEAAHALQDASAKLKATLGELHDRLQRHHDGLGKLASDVAGVNKQARALEAWADGVLAAEAKRS